MLRQTFRIPGPALLLLLLTLPMVGSAQESAATEGNPEPVRRYALEFILFRYDSSISAGTEVFPPDSPEMPGTGAAVDGELVFGDAASLGERPIYGAERPGARPDGADDIDRSAATPDEQADGEPVDDRPDYLDADLEEIVTDSVRIEMAVIPRDRLTMKAEHDKLLLLDAYEPVLWSGWTQVVLDQSASPAISLRRLGALPLEFDGTLTLYLGRFVHLDVDVALEAPVPGAAGDTRYFDNRFDDRFDNRFDDRRQSADPRRNRDRNEYGGIARQYARPVVRYRIDEDRIMRNGDLRYFDHPKFGLIAKLTLVEETRPGEEEVLPADDSATLLPGPG